MTSCKTYHGLKRCCKPYHGLKGDRLSVCSSFQLFQNTLFLTVIAFIGGLFLTPTSHAATGVEWLSTQTQLDGSFANAGDISTTYQSTTEVLKSFNALRDSTHPDIPAAVQYIDSDTFQSTEYLSRRIIVNAQQGNDVTTLTAQLKTYQNRDGGFGEFPGYDVSIIDTAFALQALVAAGEKTGASAWAAVNYLTNHQAADSSWSDGVNVSSLYTTALAMQALLPFRSEYQIAWDAANAAQGFLLAQQNADLLWGEPFVSAHVLLALIPNTVDQTLLAGSVTALQAQQSLDGSWMGDVYQTALALQALALAENPPPDPTLSNIIGGVIDAETGLALSGVTVTLTGPTADTRTTDSNGAFSFANAAAGDYSLAINYLDYAPVTATFTALAGQTLI